MKTNKDIGSELTMIRIAKPTFEFALEAQKIGHAAWLDRMPDREERIKRVFDPNDTRIAYKLLEKMRSKVGTFAGVLALEDRKPIGYAWANDDVGNLSRPVQYAKTTIGKLKGEKPYAWLAQENVKPDHQQNGTGTIMAIELMKSFDSDQKVSTYVFDENLITLNWFRRLGMNPRPDKPVPITEYFGEDTDPVYQWRLESSSAADFTKALHHSDNRLPDYTVLLSSS